MHNNRMSEKEYAERLSKLFEKIQNESVENEAILFKRYCDAEFDLTVEYRLGPDFPKERKESLRSINWQIQKLTEGFKKKYLSGNIEKQDFFTLMQNAMNEKVKRYSSILTSKEMKDFFGHEEGDYKLPFLFGSLDKLNEL